MTTEATISTTVTQRPREVMTSTTVSQLRTESSRGGGLGQGGAVTRACRGWRGLPTRALLPATPGCRWTTPSSIHDLYYLVISIQMYKLYKNCNKQVKLHLITMICLCCSHGEQNQLVDRWKWGQEMKGHLKASQDIS